jgi:HD-GYP domain-containing protein (c-di-GMP phosphodiesterase class II)
MNRPVRFLNRLANAFSAMALYAEGHPVRERVLEEAADALEELLLEDPAPRFSLLDEDVVYEDGTLPEMRNWTLGRHMARRGLQRIEIDRGVDRREFQTFMDKAARYLSRPPAALQAVPIQSEHIRFGLLETAEETEERITPFDVAAESDKVDWLQEEALMKGRVSATLARAVVQTLSTAMRYTRKVLVPLVSLKDVDQYSTIHSINTSMLAMALGEFLHLGSQQVRTIGEAALLHDMGKVAVPLEILNKPGQLTDEEWEIVRRHPQEGARILLRSGSDLELSIIAAHEHHVRWDGGGYPTLHYDRRPHRIAQLVHLCDTYDAMRTRRPHQGPITEQEIVRVISAGSGTDSDPELTAAFVRMITAWSPRILEVGETEKKWDREGSGIL